MSFYYILRNVGGTNNFGLPCIFFCSTDFWLTSMTILSYLNNFSNSWRKPASHLVCHNLEIHTWHSTSAIYPVGLWGNSCAGFDRYQVLGRIDALFNFFESHFGSGWRTRGYHTIWLHPVGKTGEVSCLSTQRLRRTELGFKPATYLLQDKLLFPVAPECVRCSRFLCRRVMGLKEVQRKFPVSFFAYSSSKSLSCRSHSISYYPTPATCDFIWRWAVFLHIMQNTFVYSCKRETVDVLLNLLLLSPITDMQCNNSGRTYPKVSLQQDPRHIYCYASVTCLAAQLFRSPFAKVKHLPISIHIQRHCKMKLDLESHCMTEAPNALLAWPTNWCFPFDKASAPA